MPIATTAINNMMLIAMLIPTFFLDFDGLPEELLEPFE